MNDLLIIDATEELQALAGELERAGLRVRACPLADASERLAAGERFDVLLLNLMESSAQAIEPLLRGGSVPARTGTLAVLRRDQLTELDLGLEVDDFALFPLPADELAARIRRVARKRAGEDSTDVLRCGDVVVDQASYRAFVGSRPVELTFKEYELLRFLVLNQEKVCTRETLLNRVWGYDFYGGARTVDVHIRRLRSKIEDPTHSLIETVRNVGYRLRAG